MGSFTFKKLPLTKEMCLLCQGNTMFCIIRYSDYNSACHDAGQDNK